MRFFTCAQHELILAGESPSRSKFTSSVLASLQPGAVLLMVISTNPAVTKLADNANLSDCSVEIASERPILHDMIFFELALCLCLGNFRCDFSRVFGSRVSSLKTIELDLAVHFLYSKPGCSNLRRHYRYVPTRSPQGARIFRGAFACH